MIQPPKLKTNDKAIIVSPAGSIDTEYVNDAASILMRWGLNVHIAENALSEVGRFSGTIEQRLYDLQNALDDENAKLILCSRGGYGTTHLLDKLDLTKFKLSPKWVIGYSDITALHSLIQKNGVMSIHGPMAKHFSEEGEDDICIEHIKNIINVENLEYNFDVTNIEVLNRDGIANGKVFGGNLAVLCGLLGTTFWHQPSDGILFIEDIAESPYKVDRFIYQLKLAGVFEDISGLIVGQFTEYEEDPLMYSSLYQSISDALQEYSFPICFNFPVGHVKDNFPLIMGKEATLIVKENHITFKQILLH